MKLSPLQLMRYVVTDICCKANPTYKPEHEILGALEHFFVNVRINATSPETGDSGIRNSWSVELDVIQKKKDDQNFPYEFHISLLGIFSIPKGTDAEKEKLFVQVNGSSTLYGIAREHVRALTAAGPWGAIILPTTSFYETRDNSKKEELPAP